MIEGVVLAQTPMMYEQEALKRLDSKMFAAKLDAASSDYPVKFEKNTLAFPDWHYGTIKFSDGTTMDSLRMNYDFNIKAMVIQFNLDISAISLRSDVVQSFSFKEGVRLREFEKIPEGAFSDIAYDMPFFELLHGSFDQNSVSIVKQLRKPLSSADEQVTYGGEVAEDKYLLSRYYHLRRAGSKKYEKFGLSKKRIVSLIGKSKSKEVVKYAKSKSLKWNNEADVMQIINHFMN